MTTFRIGSTAAVSLGGLISGAFAVLFPRLVRDADPRLQEEGVAWLGRLVGWCSGALFGSLALFAGDFVRLISGHANRPAAEILWICSAAVCVDISFHGAVQIIFARGHQGLLAKYTWVELAFNLVVTVIGVHLWGPVGSAWALAVTIVITDLIGFPIIFRRRWHGNPGLFVLRNGVLQSMVGGVVTFGLGAWAVEATRGLAPHIGIVAAAFGGTLAVGIALLRRPDRRRALSLVSPSSAVQRG